MDSEKDMEEYQGRQVFVSQLLDWDSLIHQLIIPVDKEKIFKAHYNNSIEKLIVPGIGVAHPIIILFDKVRYEALAWDSEMTSSDSVNHIRIRYSDKLVNALKNRFNDLYLWFQSGRKMEEDESYHKIVKIFLVESSFINVYILNYCVLNKTIIRDSKNTYNVIDKNLSLNSGNINILLPKVNNIHIYSFTLADNIPSLAYTKPIDFFFDNHKRKVNNWTELVTKISKLVYKSHNGFLLKCLKRTDIEFTGRYCLGAIPESMKKPVKIGDDLWIDTQFSPTNLIKFVRFMVEWCLLDSKNIIIHYKNSNSFRSLN